jgi:hypothetical protein
MRADGTSRRHRRLRAAPCLCDLDRGRGGPRWGLKPAATHGNANPGSCIRPIDAKLEIHRPPRQHLLPLARRLDPAVGDAGYRPRGVARRYQASARPARSPGSENQPDSAAARQRSSLNVAAALVAERSIAPERFPPPSQLPVEFPRNMLWWQSLCAQSADLTIRPAQPNLRAPPPSRRPLLFGNSARGLAE